MKSSRSCDFPGQISIFDYLERRDKADNPAGYLEKGERLTTLARTKYERMMDRLSFSELEKRIYSTKIPEKTDTGTIAEILSKSVVRPLIKAMTSFNESDEAFLSLKGVIDFDITLERADESMRDMSAHKYLRLRQKKTDDILVLTVREEGWPDVIVMGYRAFALTKRHNDMRWPDGSAAADIAVVLSWLILFTLYNRAMVDDDMYDALVEAFSGINADLSSMRSFVLRSSGIKSESNALDSSVPCYMPKESYRHVSSAVKRLFQKATGCSIVGHVDYSDSVFRNRNHEMLANVENPKPYGYLVEPAVEWMLLRKFPFSGFKSGVGIAVYNSFLIRDKKSKGDVPAAWALPHLNSAAGCDDFTVVFTRVIHAIWQKKGVMAKVCEYYEDLKREGKRAKVYQTKKNIPQKVLKDMEESGLNRYFGYVEIDESCDLGSLKVVSDEFELFKEKYLPALNISDVSIRFRLLGNYKAAGIFFPNLSCLCVDVRHPSSLVHELGHCIDYISGRLSEKHEFSECYRSYKKALTETLSEGKLKELKETKSKYNLDYYLLPTEVFARCTEMYVSRYLGASLSICAIEDEMDWAYPMEDGMMDEICSYFHTLFEKYGATEESAA